MMDRDPLDERLALGTGRSPTFPFSQWRGRDRFRTVHFDEGRGPALVLVHGMGGNATHWELAARDLVRDHRVVGLDLVGCGWSAKPELDYSVGLLCDHLLQVVDDLELEGATLVGHSLGGAVCIEAALRRPGRFRALALVCAAGLVRAPRLLRLGTSLAARRQLLYPWFRYASRRALQGWFVDDPRDNPDVRWFLDSTVQDATGGDNLRAMSRVSESLFADLMRCDYARHLPTLRLPTLAILTSHDTMTSSPEVRRRLARAPRVRQVVLERCGHLPFVERPGLFVAQLRDFLEPLDARDSAG